MNLPGIIMKIRYLLPITIVLAIISLFVGAYDIAPKDLLNLQSEEAQIFYISRIPR